MTEASRGSSLFHPQDTLIMRFKHTFSLTDTQSQKIDPTKSSQTRKCCSKLKIEGELLTEGSKYSIISLSCILGTHIDDPFYQNIMGEYNIDKDQPIIKYEKIGEMSGSYPVYEHVFPNFVPTEDITEPKKSYLYYYYNDHPKIQEKICPERGCWIISKMSL